MIYLNQKMDWPTLLNLHNLSLHIKCIKRHVSLSSTEFFRETKTILTSLCFVPTRIFPWPRERALMGGKSANSLPLPSSMAEECS